MSENVTRHYASTAEADAAARMWPRGRRHTFLILARGAAILSEMHFSGRSAGGHVDLLSDMRPLHAAALYASTHQRDSALIDDVQRQQKCHELNRLKGVCIEPRRDFNHLNHYAYVSGPPEAMIEMWGRALAAVERTNGGNVPFSTAGHQDYRPNNCNTGVRTVLGLLGPSFEEAAADFDARENARNLADAARGWASEDNDGRFLRDAERQRSRDVVNSLKATLPAGLTFVSLPGRSAAKT